MAASAREDAAVLFDGASGQEQRSYGFGRRYKGHDGAIDGPLSTPAIDREQVYALSPYGRLLNMRITDGKIVWSMELKKLGAKQPHYGFATSPSPARRRRARCIGGRAVADRI